MVWLNTLGIGRLVMSQRADVRHQHLLSFLWRHLLKPCNKMVDFTGVGAISRLQRAKHSSSLGSCRGFCTASDVMLLRWSSTPTMERKSLYIRPYGTFFEAPTLGTFSHLSHFSFTSGLVLLLFGVSSPCMTGFLWWLWSALVDVSDRAVPIRYRYKLSVRYQAKTKYRVWTSSKM